MTQALLPPERAMTGREYADLVAAYVVRNFEARGIVVYREVFVGKSIIGKNRIIDILVIEQSRQEGLAIECKYQSTQGTVDEKIPYALDDMRAMRMPGIIVYAGGGFSPGVLHMLRASDMAAYCLPTRDLAPAADTTRELDHVLAMRFGWWDLVVDERKRFRLTPS
jgi:hypothetical protein